MRADPAIHGLSLAILVSLGLVLTPGFADDSPNPLVGTWVGSVTIDQAELKKNDLVQGIGDGKLGGVAMALQLLASTKQMTLEFRADGTATNSLRQGTTIRQKTGKWRVVKSADGLQTIEMVEDKSAHKTEFVFRVLGPDRLELVLPSRELTRGIRHTFQRKAAT